MELKFNVTGKERKRLASAVAAFLDTSSEYMGAPGFAYKVGGYEISSDGTVVGEENIGLICHLKERGFTPEEVAPDVGRLTIEMPLDLERPGGFTPERLDNLKKLVESKGVLIKKALEVDALPIQIMEDKIAFPWFPNDADGDEVKAYSLFIYELCEAAKAKKYVIAKAQESFENEKFTMRLWLINLGLVGEEYRLVRKLLGKNLTGNCSYRREKPIAIQRRQPQNDDTPQT